MGDLDYDFAPQPHTMAVDRSISEPAYRLWAVIHFMKWNRLDPEPEAIAAIMGVHVRSVRRWLGELEQAGWLTWNRNCADPWRRLKLHTTPGAGEIAVLAQIRAMFAGGSPTIEAIRNLLDSTVQMDTDVQPDPRVQTADPTINELDGRVQTADPTINASDSPIRNGGTEALQDALNSARSEGGGGGSLVRKRRKPSAPPRRANTKTELWLLQQGVSKSKARQYRDLDLAAVTAEFGAVVGSAQGAEREMLIGRLMHRWEHRPPRPRAITVGAGTQRDDADEPASYDEERQLLPEGNEIELFFLKLLRASGLGDDQAVAQVRATPFRHIAGEIARFSRAQGGSSV